MATATPPHHATSWRRTNPRDQGKSRPPPIATHPPKPDPVAWRESQERDLLPVPFLTPSLPISRPSRATPPASLSRSPPGGSARGYLYPARGITGPLPRASAAELYPALPGKRGHPPGDRGHLGAELGFLGVLGGAAAAELCREARKWPPTDPHPAAQWVKRPADREPKTAGPPISLLIQRARRIAPAPSQKVGFARVGARPGGDLSGAPARL